MMRMDQLDDLGEGQRGVQVETGHLALGRVGPHGRATGLGRGAVARR